MATKIICSHCGYKNSQYRKTCNKCRRDLDLSQIDSGTGTPVNIDLKNMPTISNRTVMLGVGLFIAFCIGPSIISAIVDVIISINGQIIQSGGNAEMWVFTIFSILILGALLFCLALGLFFGIRVDREYERSVVFRLGKLKGIKGPGWIILLPLIDRREKIDLRTVTIDINPQDTVTKDNVTISVDAILYYKVIDPIKAITQVKNYERVTQRTALTALRNIIGQHTLDTVLQDRGRINLMLAEVVDELTDPWGIQIEMVEIKDVGIPPALQRAMAKEAEAIREKRSRLIKAEAEQEATKKLTQAAQDIAANPVALELRRMQMIQEVGTENNTTTIMLVPSDILSFAKQFNEYVSAQNGNSV